MNTKTEKSEAESAPATREEKFFGVTTSIEDMKPKKNKDEDAEKDDVFVEHSDDDDDKPSKPDKPAKKADEKGATDDDIENYSDKVQKRIDKLTWEKNEEARQRQSIQAQRDEAYRVAKVLHEQSQQQANIISTGEARLIDQIKDRARLATESARANYRKAYEEGNTDEIVAAQEALITAQAESKAANDYENEYKSRVNNWAAQQQAQQQAWKQQQEWQQQNPQQQPQQPPQQPQVVKPSSAATDWAKKNSWFGKNEHRDMTAIAYATHETLIRDKGIKPDSEEYFEGLDTVMRQRFPEYFESGQGHSGQSGSNTHAVVAPSTRGGGNTRKVTLNATQRSLAKTLGISETQYAKQLLKENKRG